MADKYLEDEEDKLKKPSVYRSGSDFKYGEDNQPKPEYRKDVEESKKKYQPVPKSHWLFNPFGDEGEKEQKEAEEELKLKKEHKKAVLKSISGGFGKDKSSGSSLLGNFNKKLGLD